VSIFFRPMAAPQASTPPVFDGPPVFDCSPYHPYQRSFAKEKVHVFYRFQQNPEELWFPSTCPMGGLACPRMGFTDGWTSAEVAEDFHPERFNEWRVRDTGVLVRYTHPHWYNRRGYAIDVGDPNMSVESVHPLQLCRVGQEADFPSIREPDVSFVVIRWGGENACDEVKEGHGGWGRTGSAVSDPYIKVLFEETVWPTLGPNYEVFSIFVRSSDDLLKLNPATIYPLLKGRHKVGMYFLWPICFQDNANSPGYVNATALLSCMANFEGCGITTRFPHHSHLYRLLLSKDWASYLSWTQIMGTAATTKVPRAVIQHNPGKAATQAITAIQKLRVFRGEAPEPKPLDDSRGIAKLGFSWEASDVRLWRGARELAGALRELSEQPGSYVEAVMVQDFVTFDIELRLFWVDAEITIDPETQTLTQVNPVKILYTAFNTVDQDHRFRDFERFQRQSAIDRCFQGDEAAMTDAEQKCVELGRKLLMFVSTECSEPLPVLRMDFMCRRAGPGKAEVHTGELTELGGCFLGWTEGPEIIWGAALRACFREECRSPTCRCKGTAPPPFLKRKPRVAGGWKGKGSKGGKGGKDHTGPTPNGEGARPPNLPKNIPTPKPTTKWQPVAPTNPPK